MTHRKLKADRFVAHDFEVKKRVKPDEKQKKILEEAFLVTPFPSKKTKEELVEKLGGISEQSIQIWFQNRRSKANKQHSPTSISKVKKLTRIMSSTQTLASQSPNRISPHVSYTIVTHPLFPLYPTESLNMLKVSLPNLSTIVPTPNYIPTDPSLYKL